MNAPTQPPIVCECGNEKRSKRAPACERCLYLDGWLPKQAAVIHALRGTDGLSLRELVEEIYKRDDRNATSSMLRTVQRMERDKRIRRYERENDSVEIEGERFGIARNFKRSGSACWVYALDGAVSGVPVERFVPVTPIRTKAARAKPAEECAKNCRRDKAPGHTMCQPHLDWERSRGRRRRAAERKAA